MRKPIAYGISAFDSNAMKSSNPHSGIYKADTSRTLDLNGGSPACNQGGIAILQPVMVLNDQGGAIMNVSEEVTSTLRAQDYGHPPLVFSQTEEPIPINTMVATRETPETRTTFGVGEPGDPQFTLSAAHSHAVFSAGFSFGQSSKARSLGYQEEVSPTLRGGEGENQKPCVVTAVPIENHPNDSRCRICDDGIVQTLSSRMGTGGNNTPFIMEKREEVKDALAVDVYNQTIDGEVTNTVTAACGGSNTSDPKVMCIGNGQADIASHISEEISQTLNCMHDQMAVMTAVDCRNGTENPDVNGTLQANEQGQNLNSNNVCRTGNTVRRLTPLECERLQAFPDQWTLIGDWTDSKGKVHKEADTPRYKALGNSIALPFWYWLLNRISAQYDEDYTPTLGSLFDGIGGFPLCWETINGKGTALWASEIEEFPIAVTKLRFPEGNEING